MNINESQRELLLYLISYLQSDKEQAIDYIQKMYGKEFTTKEVSNMLTAMRKDINKEKFNMEVCYDFRGL